MKKRTTSGGSKGKPNSRSERARNLVLTATLDLLCEAGLEGFSIDEVSKRSGVAKTTIYRHWPTRSDLLLAACSALGVKPEAPDSGNWKKDLQTVLSHVAHDLQKARWARVVPSLVDAAERDRELAAVHVQLHQQFVAALGAVIERAQQRGHLPSMLKVNELVAVLVGALFYRRWFSREGLDPRFVRNLVDWAVDESPKRMKGASAVLNRT